MARPNLYVRQSANIEQVSEYHWNQSHKVNLFACQLVREIQLHFFYVPLNFNHYITQFHSYNPEQAMLSTNIVIDYINVTLLSTPIYAKYSFK